MTSSRVRGSSVSGRAMWAGTGAAIPPATTGGGVRRTTAMEWREWPRVSAVTPRERAAAVNLRTYLSCK
eukprot:4213941-Amphidinium_carterae.2